MPNHKDRSTVVDEYWFRGIDNCPSKCRLEIIRAGGRMVVVTTDVGDNPGSNVSKALEPLVKQVCRDFALEPKQLVWIEHFAHQGVLPTLDKRTWDLVFLNIRGEGERFTVEAFRREPMLAAHWNYLGLCARQPRRYHTWPGW